MVDLMSVGVVSVFIAGAKSRSDASLLGAVGVVDVISHVLIHQKVKDVSFFLVDG
jgi:hypothetical protein